MSTVKTNNVQIGQSATATNNFTWYQPASPDGTVRLGNGNAGAVTDRVTVTSAGNVGVGTSSPTFKLQVINGESHLEGGIVTGGDTDGWGRIVNAASALYIQAGSSSSGSAVAQPIIFSNMYGGVERMRIDSAGNVGIGTTPTTTLDVAGTIRTGAAGADPGTGSAFYFVGSGAFQTVVAGAAFAVHTGSNNARAERMRISTTGEVGIGASPPGDFKLLVKGKDTTVSNYVIVCRNSADTNLFFVHNDGSFNTGAGAASPYNNTTGGAANVVVTAAGYLVRSTSSARYKENITDTTRGLGDVLKLRAVTYTSKSENDGDTVFGGMIAEEVHEAGLTEFVVYDDEGRPDALHYAPMVSLAFKAIQEQQAMIEDLRARLAALEAK